MSSFDVNNTKPAVTRYEATKMLEDLNVQILEKLKNEFHMRINNNSTTKTTVPINPTLSLNNNHINSNNNFNDPYNTTNNSIFNINKTTTTNNNSTTDVYNTNYNYNSNIPSIHNTNANMSYNTNHPFNSNIFGSNSNNSNYKINDPYSNNNNNSSTTNSNNLINNSYKSYMNSINFLANTDNKNITTNVKNNNSCASNTTTTSSSTTTLAATSTNNTTNNNSTIIIENNGDGLICFEDQYIIFRNIKYNIYTWGDRYDRMVPENFKFPRCNTKTIFTLYFHENRELMLAPYYLIGRDLTSKEDRTNYCRAKKLINIILDKAVECNYIDDKQSVYSMSVDDSIIMICFV